MGRASLVAGNNQSARALVNPLPLPFFFSVFFALFTLISRFFDFLF